MLCSTAWSHSFLPGWHLLCWRWLSWGCLCSSQPRLATGTGRLAQLHQQGFDLSSALLNPHSASETYGGASHKQEQSPRLQPAEHCGSPSKLLTSCAPGKQQHELLYFPEIEVVHHSLLCKRLVLILRHQVCCSPRV